MASRKVKKPKKRAQRATSNVFAMFAQDQIQVIYCILYNRLPARYPPEYGPSGGLGLGRTTEKFQPFFRNSKKPSI